MKDVKVIITQQKVAGKLGFGIPLILQGMAASEVVYTECYEIDEVKALFSEDSEVYKAAMLLFMQDNKPAKIAVCANTDRVTTALTNLWDKDWRQLIVTSLSEEGEDSIKVISDYIEAKDDKIYYASTKDLTESDGLSKNDRTYLMVYAGETAHPEAALVGATASFNPGSFTYKNMILKGLEPDQLKSAQVKAIHDKNAYCFITKAGDNVTSEGKSLSGEYLDIVDSRDWIIKNIGYQAQKLFNQSQKVPYTNVGIAQIESVIINVLKQAYANGMVSDTEDGLPAFSTNFASRADTPVVDRASRQYLGGKFQFTLAGAIHEATIQGEIIF